MRLRSTTLTLAPAVVAAIAVMATPDATAQCCGTPAVAPTVAYSPVVAPAPTVAYSPVVSAAPVVQTTTVSDGWYPGKYLTDFTRNLFGLNRTTVAYTAGYAPVAPPVVAAPAYTAGYAPLAQTAYRPTYPITYGTVQTVARPVVLRPVATMVPACDPCAGGCSSCVATAGYAAPMGGSCAACQPAGGFAAPAPAPAPTPAEPQPALRRDEFPRRDRGFESQRPRIEVQDNSGYGTEYGSDPLDDGYDSVLEGDDASADDLGDSWPLQAPPLFQGPSNDRVTARHHPAPVRTAVYRRSTGDRGWVTPTAARTADTPRRLSGDGWASAD